MPIIAGTSASVEGRTAIESGLSSMEHPEKAIPQGSRGAYRRKRLPAASAINVEQRFKLPNHSNVKVT
jgi:hypothetical protein